MCAGSCKSQRLGLHHSVLALMGWLKDSTGHWVKWCWTKSTKLGPVSVHLNRSLSEHWPSSNWVHTKLPYVWSWGHLTCWHVDWPMPVEYVQNLTVLLEDAYHRGCKCLRRAAEAQKKREYDTRMVLHPYEVGDLVYCRNPMAKKLDTAWIGPLVVTKKYSQIL